MSDPNPNQVALILMMLFLIIVIGERLARLDRKDHKDVRKEESSTDGQPFMGGD